MDFDFGQVSELLGSMSEEELQNLQEAAQSLFSQLGGENENNAQEPRPDAGGGPGLGGMFTPELLARLTQIMGRMHTHDPRTDLILALRPHLSRRRQKRAEQAVQMMKMLDLLPALQGAVRG
ncbi:MAG: hypothetical protein FWF60_06610 [Oscillospiraceae bacterium]|nr:hypothetical protein [Oscillospiraceae bacterium]